MTIPVLLVEDEQGLRDLVAEALSDFGFAVTSAADGREAIAHLQGERAFAVLVTDFSMPNGVSGLDVAVAASRSQPAARVVLASGLPTTQLPPIPAAVRFLPKPYRIQQLVSAIEDALV